MNDHTARRSSFPLGRSRPVATRTTVLAAAALAGIFPGKARAATQYFAGDGSALTASKWGTAATGPFTSAFAASNVFAYGNTNPGTGTGGSIIVGGMTFTQSFTVTSPNGTISNISDGVITVSVASGKTADFGSQAFTSSATAGYTKTGSGVLALMGGAYRGGFTLESGTVVLRGAVAMGDVGALTINGGTIAANATRDLSGRYTSITVGGNFQLGALPASISIANATANLTFNANMAIGSGKRFITIGANGTYSLNGNISGGTGTGLTINADPDATGKLVFGGSNSYSGGTTFNGGTVSVSSNGNLGAVAGTLTFSGGTLAITTGFTMNRGTTINAGGAIITIVGGQTLVQQGALTGAGGLTLNRTSGVTNASLTLSSASTFSGDTKANTGTILTLGSATALQNSALDTSGAGTVALSGLTTLTLGGLRGSTDLASVITGAYTGVTALTLNPGTGVTNTYAGVITNGASGMTVAKTGNGTQVLTGTNAFTGATTVSAGTLQLGDGVAATIALNNTASLSVTSTGSLILGSSNQINNSANLTLAGTTFDLGGKSEGSAGTTGLGTLTLSNGGTLDFGTFGAAISLIQFAGVGAHSGTFSIVDYDAGTDHLYFAGNPSEFNFLQGEVSFNGVSGYEIAFNPINSYYEVSAAIPEPATVCGILGLVGLAGYRERRRFAKLLRRA